ncbi:MAG: MATE family efflux transporter [Desulfobacterales bacterium]|nr:MAG: MATE family efflux transporter [Desulfobacterales bacterium]
MQPTDYNIAAGTVAPRAHPFIHAPNTTLLSMSLPVLLSLIAEPLTGLVDTAFIARLGSVSLAALGVGTVGLSGIYWVFNFLGIGTQTEISQAFGRQSLRRVAEIGGLALALAVIFGLLLLAAGLALVPYFSTAMGADGAVHYQATQYLRIRLFGAPAVMITVAGFGILRGLQDMRNPLWIALIINILNIILDAFLIFGYGALPALGVAGAALASVISQWIGAAAAGIILYRKIGIPGDIRVRDIRRLFQIGGEMFIRTGLATAFFLLTTRVATRIGPDAGAAHQAIRQVWMFTTLLLDSYAVTAQSLVGFFMGPALRQQARRVAHYVFGWSAATGLALALLMLLGQAAIMDLIVPPSAIKLFIPAWIVSAVTQPVNALTYATDGIHWGTGDFRFLRNVMLAATVCCGSAIFLLDENRGDALTWLWVITCAWIWIRAVFGVLRVWPGIGKSPLKDQAGKI